MLLCKMLMERIRSRCNTKIRKRHTHILSTAISLVCVAKAVNLKTKEGMIEVSLAVTMKNGN